MVWIVGDEFVHTSFNQYVRHSGNSSEEQKFHMKELYEIKDAASDKYTSLNTNMVCRVRNHLIQMIKEYVLLPKAIVLILDDDLIRFVEYEGNDVIVTYKKILSWLMKEVHRLILSYKDLMPNKARRYKYPAVLWIAPPMNINFFNNDLRKDFIIALDDVVATYPEMWALQLKKVWEPDNRNYYNDESNRYTATGLSTYWRAVDSTFKFWDTNLNHKAMMKSENHAQKSAAHFNNFGKNNYKKQGNYYNKGNRHNPYIWKNNQRRLPSPPPRRDF